MGIEQISGSDTFAHNCEQLFSDFSPLKWLLVAVVAFIADGGERLVDEEIFQIVRLHTKNLS
jgi:hypothetical protein